MKVEAKREIGRSMIEMLGILGIMAVITVLSMKAYTMAMKSVKMNKIKEVSLLVMNRIDTIYNNRYEEIINIGGNSRDKFNGVFVDTGLMEDNNHPFDGQYGLGAWEDKQIPEYYNIPDEEYYDFIEVILTGLDEETAEYICSNSYFSDYCAVTDLTSYGYDYYTAVLFFLR